VLTQGQRRTRLQRHCSGALPEVVCSLSDVAACEDKDKYMFHRPRPHRLLVHAHAVHQRRVKADFGSEGHTKLALMLLCLLLRRTYTSFLG
jgi:hypothetical protein